MKDHTTFVECFSRYIHMSELSEQFQQYLFHWQKGFQVYVGRGCTLGCSYCGGSKAAHELIAARQAVALRSVDAIVSSICDLQHFGFDSACLALDSFPVARADEYYVPIFENLKQRNVSLDIEVERYFLPTAQFIESFSGLRGKKSFVTLSPHSHNRELREKNGLHRYSNEALEKCLDQMEAHGVNSLVCFTCGLPFETKKDLEGMVAYQRTLRKRYKRMRVRNCLIEIEPGSGMSSCSVQYELEPARKTFADYYHYHSLPAQNHWLEMGYTRQGCPAKDEVTRFFCRNCCERFKPVWASPVMCDILSFMLKIRAFQTLDKVLPLKPTE